ILFHTAGIVFLTLVINGTTTKGLLQTLKLTEVTAGQKEQMNTAVRRISHTQWKLTRGYQSYKYMIDASWDVVNSVCTVTNPYIVETEDAKKVVGLTTLNPPRPVKGQHNSVLALEMTNDARLGVIKAMKVHYSHQFEEGVLTESAVQVLLTDAEYAEDIYLCTIQSHNFHKHMKVHGFYPWLRDKVIVRFGLHKEESLPEPPSCRWRYPFYWVVTRDWFDPIGMTIVLLNVGLAVAELVYSYYSDNPEDECLWTQSEQRYKLVFYWANVTFTIFYSIEASIRLLGQRFRDYICSWWNYLDLFVLAIACGDLYLGYIAIDDALCKQSKILQSGFRNYFNLLRFARLLRAIRLLKPIMPHLLRKIKRETHVQVFTGYDIGRGFVKASDDVIKFIPQICENKKVQQVIKHGMQREVNSCVKDLALIQNKFPGVAVALQTRHACRTVLNRMIFALNDVQDGGLLDESEVKLLQHLIEEKMRRLTHSPHYITPTNPLTTHNDAFNDEEDKGDKKVSDDAGIPHKIATNP
ncbi:Sodium/hydrogen exchanger 10, partial [Orchesella cincta]